MKFTDEEVEDIGQAIYFTVDVTEVELVCAILVVDILAESDLTPISDLFADTCAVIELLEGSFWNVLIVLGFGDESNFSFFIVVMRSINPGSFVIDDSINVEVALIVESADKSITIRVAEIPIKAVSLVSSAIFRTSLLVEDSIVRVSWTIGSSHTLVSIT